MKEEVVNLRVSGGKEMLEGRVVGENDVDLELIYEILKNIKHFKKNKRGQHLGEGTRSRPQMTANSLSTRPLLHKRKTQKRK